MVLRLTGNENMAWGGSSSAYELLCLVIKQTQFQKPVPFPSSPSRGVSRRRVSHRTIRKAPRRG